MQFSTHDAAVSSGIYNKEFSTSLNYTPFNDSLPRSPRRKEQKIYRFGRGSAIHEMSGRAINKHARTGRNRVSSSRFLPVVSRSQLRLVIPPTFDRDAHTFPRFPYVCPVQARYVAGRRRDRVPIAFSRSLSRLTPSGFSTIRARRVITTVTRPFSLGRRAVDDHGQRSSIPYESTIAALAIATRAVLLIEWNFRVRCRVFGGRVTIGKIARTVRWLAISLQTVAVCRSQRSPCKFVHHDSRSIIGRDLLLDKFPATDRRRYLAVAAGRLKNRFQKDSGRASIARPCCTYPANRPS